MKFALAKSWKCFANCEVRAINLYPGGCNDILKVACPKL